MTSRLCLAGIVLAGAALASIPPALGGRASARRGEVSAYFHAPAWDDYAEIRPGGVTITPSGRFLTPAGRLIWTPMNAYTARFNSEGAALCAAEGGKLLVAERPTETEAGERWVESKGASPSFTVAADGTIYWSGGDDGTVRRVPRGATAANATWSLNVGTFKDSVVADLAVSPDGKRLYVADVTNFRIVCFDTSNGALVSSTSAGRYPYALTLSPDGKRLWVANIGVFRYQRIATPTSGKFDGRGLSRPAFGFPSKEARDGVEFEGRWVPGLGDPNNPESFSVWGMDVSDPSHIQTTHRIKTGALVNAAYENGRTVGGSSPCALLQSGDRLFVANSNNDTVDVIDTRKGAVSATIRIRPVRELERYRGVTPYGMALSPDGKRLFVCEAGMNALAVIDTQRLTVVGHIPTAWYPTSVDVSRDGKWLIVANAKGLGWGPRDDRKPRRAEQTRFGSVPGCLQVLPVPNADALKSHTRQVLMNNGLVADPARLAGLPREPISPLPGSPSRQIKYVVFITKENHTYDGILGASPGGKGDRELAWWGAPRKIGEHDNVVVMPNHLKLAKEFAHSDNFYMEPEASGDGHRWLVGAYPNVWCQRMFEQGYSFKANSPAPGRLVSFGSNGSIAPEDYLESGTVWEHLSRAGISFRNYGEGFEQAGQLEEPGTKPTGSILPVNIPMPKPLFDNTCFEFPAYNNNIPDQYRVDQFVKDLEQYGAGKQAPLPRFLNAAICNDHGASPMPKYGYPYSASFLADNDLALGRMVEYLTKRPEWKEMAIFVTQDDSGGDPDHVDRHRSICMVISPWVKRGYVSHRHTSISSILKTIYLTYGLPPCNLYDGLSSDLTDVFTTRPNYDGYRHVGVDARVFDPARARDPGDPDYKQARLRRSIPMDDPRFSHHLRPDGDSDDE